MQMPTMIILLVFIFFSTHILRKKLNSLEESNYPETILSFLASLVLFISFVHIFSLVLGNIQIGIFISLFLFLVPYTFIFKDKLLASSIPKLELKDFFILGLSLVLGILFFYFDKNIGQADVSILVSNTL